MNLKQAIVAFGLALCAPFASATVLTFEDLVGQGPMGSYGGFTWTAWDHYDWAQPPYNPSSGVVRLYDYDASNSISSANDFVFNGAMFAGLTSTSVSFELYNNGNLVHSSSSVFVGATPFFLSSGYAGLIDQVKVVSNAHDQFVMDDFTYNSTAPVPEPETYAMMLAGLAMLGVTARRRRQKHID